ncbi:MAG: P-II family nitrogen regulator [Nitrospirae bacterium]|nr:P-II family nitrogen regulator [Candidatus Manganitrophaceae bacterium]
MKLIQALIRPEKEGEVIAGLEKSGIYPFTRQMVFGRGRQRGIQVGPVRYEELSKVWLMIAVEEEEIDRAVETIKIAARTGNPGDGKIFISSLSESRAIWIQEKSEI